jgi:hypothetical protein
LQSLAQIAEKLWWKSVLLSTSLRFKYFDLCWICLYKACFDSRRLTDEMVLEI